MSFFWSVSNQVGKFSIQTFISGQWWWRSHQSLARKGLCILRFGVMSMERGIRSEHQILFKKNSWVDSKILHNTELWTQPTEKRWNSSGTFSQDSLHRSSSKRTKSSWTQWASQAFQGRIIFMSLLNDIICWIKDNEVECTANSTLVSLLAKRFPAGHWSFLGPGSETKCYSSYNEDHKENGTESLNWWWWSNSEKA